MIMMTMLGRSGSLQLAKKIGITFVLTGGERGSEKEISNSARAFPGLVGLKISSNWTKENGAISPEESCRKMTEQHQDTTKHHALPKHSSILSQSTTECKPMSAVHQGRVARSMISVNHWLSCIKSYRLSWYLTLV